MPRISDFYIDIIDDIIYQTCLVMFRIMDLKNPLFNETFNMLQPVYKTPGLW
jgi:hypothetical protein